MQSKICLFRSRHWRDYVTENDSLFHLVSEYASKIEILIQSMAQVSVNTGEIGGNV